MLRLRERNASGSAGGSCATGRCRHWDNRDCEGPEWENEWFERVMMYDSPLSLSGVYIRVGMAVISDRERSVCLSRPEIDYQSPEFYHGDTSTEGYRTRISIGYGYLSVPGKLWV